MGGHEGRMFDATKEEERIKKIICIDMSEDMI